MIDFLKKYKTQIFNIITIFLILEFAIYPGLTTANTFSNIIAGIGLLLLIVWAGLALYEYVRNSDGLVDKQELKEAQEMKDKFQTLAGIKPYDSQKGTNDLVDIMTKAEQIKKEGFPPESESIPMNSFPITKIKVNEASDPLSDIPLSRVSKEAKQKMAKIAMKDISDRLDTQTKHMLESELGTVIDQLAKEVLEAPADKDIVSVSNSLKPKRKYTKKPKQ